MLIIGLGVGIVVSLLQAVTQIQEQTLTFVPKIAAMVAAAIVLMPWISHACSNTHDHVLIETLTLTVARASGLCSFDSALTRRCRCATQCPSNCSNLSRCLCWSSSDSPA